MTDRAALLARIADDFMASGYLPLMTDEMISGGMRALRCECYPAAPARPSEIRFVAEWPAITLVCSRSLSGYSLEGGLHRDCASLDSPAP